MPQGHRASIIIRSSHSITAPQQEQRLCNSLAARAHLRADGQDLHHLFKRVWLQQVAAGVDRRGCWLPSKGRAMCCARARAIDETRQQAHTRTHMQAANRSLCRSEQHHAVAQLH